MACDFDVPYNNQSQESINEVLLSLFNSGYQKVALNHTVTQLNKSETAEFKQVAANAKKYFEKLGSDANSTKEKQYALYTRLTLVLSSSGNKDESVGQVLHGATAQGYELLAVAPASFKDLQPACSIPDIDLVVLPAHAFTSFIRHSVVKTAVDRGVYFEISLGPYLTNPELRKNYFASGTAIVTSTKGKNILLSNGAVTGLGVRGAADLANLGQLLGLGPGTTSSSSSSSTSSSSSSSPSRWQGAHHLLARVQARASAKSVLRVLPEPEPEPEPELESEPEKGQKEKEKEGEEGSRPQKGPALDFIPLAEADPPKRKGKRKASNQGV